MRRVVVTGLGMVTPLGCGVEHTWQRLVTGQSGVRRVERFDVSDLPARIAGQIPLGDGSSVTLPVIEHFFLGSLPRGTEVDKAVALDASGNEVAERPLQSS